MFRYVRNHYGIELPVFPATDRQSVGHWTQAIEAR